MAFRRLYNMDLNFTLEYEIFEITYIPFTDSFPVMDFFLNTLPSRLVFRGKKDCVTLVDS